MSAEATDTEAMSSANKHAYPVDSDGYGPQSALLGPPQHRLHSLKPVTSPQILIQNNENTISSQDQFRSSNAPTPVKQLYENTLWYDKSANEKSFANSTDMSRHMLPNYSQHQNLNLNYNMNSQMPGLSMTQVKQ